MHFYSSPKVQKCQVVKGLTNVEVRSQKLFSFFIFIPVDSSKIGELHQEATCCVYVLSGFHVGADVKIFWRRQQLFWRQQQLCFHIQRDIDVKRALTTSKVKLTSRKMTPSVPNVKDALRLRSTLLKLSTRTCNKVLPFSDTFEAQSTLGPSSRWSGTTKYRHESIVLPRITQILTGNSRGPTHKQVVQVLRLFTFPAILKTGERLHMCSQQPTSKDSHKRV